jgi:hypothetical protein
MKKHLRLSLLVDMPEPLASRSTNHNHCPFHHEHYKPSMPIEIPTRRKSTISPTRIPVIPSDSPELIFEMSPLEAPLDIHSPTRHTIALTALPNVDQKNSRGVAQQSHLLTEEPFLYPFPVLPTTNRANTNSPPSPEKRASSLVVAPPHNAQVPQRRRKYYLTSASSFWRDRVDSPLCSPSRSISLQFSSNTTTNLAALNVVSNERQVSGYYAPFRTSHVVSPLSQSFIGGSGSNKDDRSVDSESNPFRFEEYLIRRIDDEKLHQIHHTQHVLSMRVSICG